MCCTLHHSFISKYQGTEKNRVSMFFLSAAKFWERTGLKLVLCDVRVWKLHVVEIRLACTCYSLSQQELSLFLALSSDKCNSSQHSQHPPSIDKMNCFDAYIQSHNQRLRHTSFPCFSIWKPASPSCSMVHENLNLQGKWHRLKKQGIHLEVYDIINFQLDSSWMIHFIIFISDYPLCH